MSEPTDVDSNESIINTDVIQTSEDIHDIVDSKDVPPLGSTLNPVDEESQFIYDDETSRLTCIGSNYTDLPQSIIDTFSLKTKILDLSKNRFRSLACIRHFSNLEELILDDNDLDDIHTRFPKLNNLNTLMINKNRFQDLYKLIEQIRNAYPMLTYLSLLGNEACPYRLTAMNQISSNDVNLSVSTQSRIDEEYRRYKHLLIYRIPTLKFIDASEITPNDRRVATQLGDILISIGEVRKNQVPVDPSDEDQGKDAGYTPLPTDSSRGKGNGILLVATRRTPNGQGSQGNKFVQDPHL